MRGRGLYLPFLMRIIFPYLILLSTIFFSNIYFIDKKHFVVTVALIVLCLIFCPPIKLNFKTKDLILTLKTILIIFSIPSISILLLTKQIIKPSFSEIVYLFFAVAIPEEIFFRGFIQEELGNTTKAIFLTSLLFSIAHLPNMIFENNFLYILTFLPSIVMGWLYMKTSNILPSIFFHFFADLFYYSVFCQFVLK